MVLVGLSDALKKAGMEGWGAISAALNAPTGLEVASKRYRVTTDSDHNETISRINWIVNLLWQNLIRSGQRILLYVWTLEGWLYVAIVSIVFPASRGLGYC